MDRIWLKHYPAGIPGDVDVNAWSSLKEVLEDSCRRFADLPAYSNMGTSISYAELACWRLYCDLAEPTP